MGGALGLAVLSTIAAAQTRGEVVAGAARALTDGFDLAFAVGGLFCVAGALLAAFALRGRPGLAGEPQADAGEARQAERGEAVAA